MAGKNLTPIPDTQMAVPPWDRAEKEGDRAYQAFTVYRDMGPARSITKAAQALNKNRTTLGTWNSRWRWRERVVSWDHEMERMRRVDLLDAVRKMEDRHAGLASSGLELLRAIPLAFQAKLKAAASQEELIAELADLDLPELVELMARASAPIDRLTKTERLARGEPSEVTRAEEFAVTVSAEELMTDDDPSALAEFLGILSEAGILNAGGSAEGPAPADS